MIKASDILAAAHLLQNGGLVAFPTETVYGLGADATSDKGVARIFAAKQRPQFNPLISHVHEADAAFQLGTFSKEAETLAARFWPGPLTLVVERRKDCPVSLLCSAGLSSIALRVPNHPIALELLRTVGRPLAAPSANLSGRISPTTADHVRKGLGGAVDMVLDGGASGVGVESTVVQFDGAKATLLRSGGITREEIEAVLGQKLQNVSAAATALHGPGMLESHYAPRAALRLNALSPKIDEAYLSFGTCQSGPWNLSPSGNLQEAAANLFNMLHAIDDSSPELIAVAPIPMTGLGEAINDRLQRAAAPRPKP
jgi:L-threonylcarbamoyladenylate synthase